MHDPLNIPAEFRALFRLLRCAVNRRPPEDGLIDSTDWTTVLTQARQHGVDTYLYPWLAANAPALFSARANVPPDSAPAVWRALFLEAIPLTILRQRQLAEILAAFAKAEIDVIPLKGAWLSETVYDDPAQRSMSDLDILIRANDRDAGHALFLSLGYQFERDVLHNAFFHDQKYFHVAHPLVVEVHWQFTSSLEPDFLAPDLEAIWGNTLESTLYNQPIRQLSPDDQLTHLVQHILRHGFAIHLRGYLDLALILQKFWPAWPACVLDAAAKRWEVGRSLAFALSVTSVLFTVDLPVPLRSYLALARNVSVDLALRILLSLPAAEERHSESMVLCLRQASPLKRIQLVLSRTFLPRDLLAALYPCARHPFGIPLAWLYRLHDLLARYRNRVSLSLAPSNGDLRTLANAQMREELVRSLLNSKKNLTVFSD
jgi:hypothetical protein